MSTRVTVSYTKLVVLFYISLLIYTIEPLKAAGNVVAKSVMFCLGVSLLRRGPSLSG